MMMKRPTPIVTWYPLHVHTMLHAVNAALREVSHGACWHRRPLERKSNLHAHRIRRDPAPLRIPQEQSPQAFGRSTVGSCHGRIGRICANPLWLRDSERRHTIGGAMWTCATWTVDSALRSGDSTPRQLTRTADPRREGGRCVGTRRIPGRLYRVRAEAGGPTGLPAHHLTHCLRHAIATHLIEG